VGATVVGLMMPLGAVSVWIPVFRAYGWRGWRTVDFTTRMQLVEVALAYLGLLVLSGQAIISRRPDRDARLVGRIVWLMAVFGVAVVLTSLIR
jgi:hypothetical protein